MLRTLWTKAGLITCVVGEFDVKIYATYLIGA